jgi:hypothetical protein
LLAVELGAEGPQPIGEDQLSMGVWVWNRHRTLQNLIYSPEFMKMFIDASIWNLSTNSSSTVDYPYQITIYIYISHRRHLCIFSSLIAAISEAQVDLVYSGPVFQELSVSLNPYLMTRPDRAYPAVYFVRFGGLLF